MVAEEWSECAQRLASAGRVKPATSWLGYLFANTVSSVTLYSYSPRTSLATSEVPHPRQSRSRYGYPNPTAIELCIQGVWCDKKFCCTIRPPVLQCLSGRYSTAGLACFLKPRPHRQQCRTKFRPFDKVDSICFDIVERIVQLVAFDNVAWASLLVRTGLYSKCTNGCLSNTKTSAHYTDVEMDDAFLPIV